NGSKAGPLEVETDWVAKARDPKTEQRHWHWYLTRDKKPVEYFDTVPPGRSLGAWEVSSLSINGSGKLFVLDGNKIVTRAREWYQWEINQPNHCVWIELEDFATPEGALHEILATVALQRGTFQLEHAEFVSREWNKNTITQANADKVVGKVKERL